MWCDLAPCEIQLASNAGQDLMLDESEEGDQQPNPAVPLVSAASAANPSHQLSLVVLAGVIAAVPLGLAAVTMAAVGVCLYLQRSGRRPANATDRMSHGLADLTANAEEQLPLNSEPAERASSSSEEQQSARVDFAGDTS